MDLQIVRIGKRTSSVRGRLGFDSDSDSSQRGELGVGGEFRVGGVGMRGPGK